MIPVKNSCENTDLGWQTDFLKILPEIQRRLRLAFCCLDPDAREDSIEEGIVHCLLAYARLHEQGRTETVTPSSLAWYSSKQVKRGRPSAGRMSSKEPLSRYAQIGKRIKVERLQFYSKKCDDWIETIVEDKRASIVDQVAAKMDVSAWFATLTQGMRQIAEDLAFGFTTSEVARKHGLTASRISQLRRALKQSWAAFQQEAAPASTM